MYNTTHSFDRFLGRKLKNDVYNSYGVIVLSADTRLTKEHLDKLIEHDIYLSDKDVTAEIREEQRQIIDQVVSQAASLFEEIRDMEKLPLQEITKEIIPNITEATEQHDLFKLFSFLQEGDDYTYRHNIGVGVISTLLGKWLNLDKEDLAQLTIAATLHDIGKMKIPSEILNKPGSLTKEEFDIVKQHTVLGYEMIKETAGTTHRQALVALQHHERQDGSGYPYGIAGGAIDRFSRIVAVADVFHAMSCNRVYRSASPFYEILREMQQHRFGVFDPKVISIFIEKMMQSLVGNQVELTDEQVGLIVMVNPQDPISPLVQVDQSFIDLSKDRSLHIKRVLT